MGSNKKFINFKIENYIFISLKLKILSSKKLRISKPKTIKLSKSSDFTSFNAEVQIFFIAILFVVLSVNFFLFFCGDTLIE